MVTLKFRESTTQSAPIALPGSKSMAARALILNALSDRQCRLVGIPHCEDTDALRHALETVAEDKTATINVGGAGTAMRFITALAAATPDVHILLTGSERMTKRPIGPLVDALRQAGADIEYQRHDDYPPLLIKGTPLKGDNVEIRADVSSQFISALMMIAPTIDGGLAIHRKGARTVSRPYIDMTASMMRQFGAHIDQNGTDIIVHGGKYQAPDEYVIEPDWSAASYFYEIAALLNGKEVAIENLLPPEKSLQGDARCAQLFSNLGVSTEYLPDGTAVLRGGGQTRIADEDLSQTPDLVPALAVAHCLCGVPFRFKGIDHLRLKESNRLDVIVAELRKLGFVASEHDDVLEWSGEICSAKSDEPIRTHDDHRIAMAFAPAVYKFKELVILHEGVVDKSYPLYWSNLEKLGIRIYL
ncbi:MAG: 3-phosphoshikimate 1-carboxyvinyltransferase [Muribaculaceae bacterium]|nr:3-phosphoshikimate 1-carboxyvinyltransferase [Muribaculaceae bacterium]